MKRIISFILACLFTSLLTGCLASSRNTAGGSDNLLTDFLSPYNDIGSTSSRVINTLPKNMSYHDIIKLLGKTKDIGSGLHVAKYKVDGDKELLLSFSNPDEPCPLSGKEMLKKLVPLTDYNGLGS